MPTLDLLGTFIEWGEKRRANRLSEAQDCPQKQEQVARDVNAQRHTNTFRPHPLDHLYLDFTLVCSPEECGCYYRTSTTTTTDAITIVVAATAAATTTTIAIRGSDIDRYFQFLCPFSRLLLRTCSYVHETICTVFNVIFQSRPLLLSRSSFCLSIFSHGVSFT